MIAPACQLELPLRHDEAWIRRFAAPVLAEQARIVERARGVVFTKRGVGPAGAALGPAVAANVIDRGVPLTLPDIEAAWGAYQHPGGGWHVTFRFPLRGRRQTAEWEIDLNDAKVEDGDFLEQSRDDMEHPFRDVIAEAMTMTQYGWAFLEVVYKLRAGQGGEQWGVRGHDELTTSLEHLDHDRQQRQASLERQRASGSSSNSLRIS